MTMALCLNCGDIKFGALCPCPKCQAASTGNMQLDIAFSDHRYDVSTLRQLGGVIKEIRAHCGERSTCFWTFIQYVSQNHPEILRVEIRPEAQPAIEALMAQCTFPEVVVKPGRSGLFRRILDHFRWRRT